MAFSKHRDPPRKRAGTAGQLQRENDPVKRAKDRVYEAVVAYSDVVETTRARRRPGKTVDDVVRARNNLAQARQDERGAIIKANTPDMLNKKLRRRR